MTHPYEDTEQYEQQRQVEHLGPFPRFEGVEFSIGNELGFDYDQEEMERMMRWKNLGVQGA